MWWSNEEQQWGKLIEDPFSLITLSAIWSRPIDGNRDGSADNNDDDDEYDDEKEHDEDEYDNEDNNEEEDMQELFNDVHYGFVSGSIGKQSPKWIYKLSLLKVHEKK